MVGFARSLIIVMIAVVSLIVFFNAAFFFPWYLTMVETGFATAQMIATDNYLSYDNYTSTVDGLREAPIFCKVENPLEHIDIEAWHIDENKLKIRTAIEPLTYLTQEQALEEYYWEANEDRKPYTQMGNMVLITVKASYPFQMQLFGSPLRLTELPLTFSMTTTTTKHYKDLEYTYVMNPSHTVDEDLFAGW